MVQINLNIIQIQIQDKDWGIRDAYYKKWQLGSVLNQQSTTKQNKIAMNIFSFGYLDKFIFKTIK